MYAPPVCFLYFPCACAVVRMASRYGIFGICTTTSAPYLRRNFSRLEATGNYADIKYPNALNVSRFDESGSRTSVSGTAGDGKGFIKVKLNYGEFVMR